MTDTTAPPRWTTYMPVAALAPALKNAKAHDQAAMGASVREFGFLEPVVLDERTSRLVAGHGRVEWLAEREAEGAPPPEGVTLDAEGRWCWLVTRGWSSRDDQHAHAAGIALNRVGEKGGWVPETLVELLDQIIGSPMGEASGFTADDLDDLITTVASASAEDASSAWRTNTPGEDEERYRASAVRAIILNFPTDRYAFIVERFGQLRSQWKFDTNAAVVERMLIDACADPGTSSDTQPGEDDVPGGTGDGAAEGAGDGGRRRNRRTGAGGSEAG